MSESALKQFIASEAEYIKSNEWKQLEARSTRKSTAAAEPQGQEAEKSASDIREEQKEADVRVLLEREPLQVPPMPTAPSSSQDTSNEPQNPARKPYITPAQRALELYEASVFRDLWQYFHLPQEEAWKASKWDRSTFTKLCQDFGIGQWPYRAIASVNLSMAQLEEALRLTKPSIQTIEHVENYLRQLRASVDEIVAASCKTYHLGTSTSTNGRLADYAARKKEYRVRKAQKKLSGNELEADEESDETDSDHEQALDVAAEQTRQREMHKRINALNKTTGRFARNMLLKAGLSAADLGVLRKYPTIFYVGKDAPQADKLPNEAPAAAPVLKKGWTEEKEDGRLHVHRLPVRDELLDTLGTAVSLRTLQHDEWEGFDTEAEFFTQQEQNDTSSSALPPMKKNKLLCHDGEVLLPALDLQDTSDINKEGLTIILIEPQIFQHQIATNVVDFVPSFVVRETRNT